MPIDSAWFTGELKIPQPGCSIDNETMLREANIVPGGDNHDDGPPMADVRKQLKLEYAGGRS
ncbi:hypothetical protein Hypma_003332 [Hypsizygus marmoreus]|uniref:Uncharacterized protein n=1 Tax=Hypsizygus marmoreus TaxID=39966 RepID=A0A369J8U0_HYPMA|nr:hypothetical protein Hypma_003332 [Hypsizygus marmoreus]